MDSLPKALIERLNSVERRLIEEISGQKQPPATIPADYVRELKRLRFTRERAAIQREIDRLQELRGPNYDQEIDALGHRKIALMQQIESLMER